MKFIRTTKTASDVVVDTTEATPGAATVLAAGINPVDLAIASGMLPFRALRSGDALGFEGVARTSDGAVKYFSSPTPPQGSFCQSVHLDGADTAEVPEGLDPVLAAAIGVPGIAAWMALIDAGEFSAGDRVLVLGGAGTVGRIATQIALAEGASVVAATGRRPDDIDDLSALGAVPVEASDPSSMADHLGKVSAEGFDVVVDTLWGEPFAAALGHVRSGARIAQVGNSAGAEASVSAPAFRNLGVKISGHSNFLATADQRRRAYENVARHAASGGIDVPVTTIGLEAFPEFWASFAAKEVQGKHILVP